MRADWEAVIPLLIITLTAVVVVLGVCAFSAWDYWKSRPRDDTPRRWP